MSSAHPTSNYANLCMFQHSDGRYCGLPSQSSTGLCRAHSNLNKPKSPVEEDLTTAMLHLTSQPDLDVHAALQVVFKALIGNHITNKRAATFGYLGQLILLSDPNSKLSLPKIDPDKPASIPGKFVKSAPIDESTMQNLLAELRKKFPKHSESPHISRHRDSLNPR